MICKSIFTAKPVTVSRLAPITAPLRPVRPVLARGVGSDADRLGDKAEQGARDVQKQVRLLVIWHEHAIIFTMYTGMHDLV